MTDNKDIRELMGNGDLSAMIERLKEHPEIVSTVASALGLGTAAPSSETSNSTSPPPIPDMLSAIAPLMSKKDTDPHKDDRMALLTALKPYLSQERRQIVDYIIQFSKIGDLMKNVK